MSIDLDDIESRINDGIYGDDRMSATARDDAFSALAALLNEVEQLRTEASYLRACVPPTRPTDYGHEAWAETVRDAVDAERAAVVAWLDAREEELNAEGEAAQVEGHRAWAFDRASEAAHIACIIERGEHRREGGE